MTGCSLPFKPPPALISNRKPPPTVPEIKAEKKVGYAFTDQQVVALVEDEKDPKWQFAYQLLSVYGLRPEELRHLVIKKGINGKELWCIYRNC